jgi:hypothetical protein
MWVYLSRFTIPHTRANNTSSHHGGQSMSHPIITLYLVWCISHSNSWSTSLGFKQKFCWKMESISQILFWNKIYRSWLEVLRKLGRMTLTFELQILQLVISLRSKSSLDKVVFSSYKSLQHLFQGCSCIQILSIGYTLLCLLLVLCGILQLSQFTEVS